MAKAAEHDVVKLKSGNRLFGTVTKLSRGTLSFSIEGAGGVDITWSNVESLESVTVLDVELASGQRLKGTLGTQLPGKLEIKSAGNSQVVDMKEVVWMLPIATTFLKRTSGSIDGGLAALQANSEVDVTVDAEFSNRTRNYLTEGSFSSLLRRRNEENSQWRNYFDLNSRRYFGNRWFVLGNLGIEQDQRLDLDLRTVVYGAFGRTLIQSNRTIFAVYGGVDYDRENYGGFPISNSSEGLGAVEWDWFDAGSKTELLSKATTYLTLNRQRVRLEFKTELRHDLPKNFYGAVGVFESYDSDPPSNQHNNDAGLTITFGRSF
jgi:hypothetical protein